MGRAAQLRTRPSHRAIDTRAPTTRCADAETERKTQRETERDCTLFRKRTTRISRDRPTATAGQSGLTWAAFGSDARVHSCAVGVRRLRTHSSRTRAALEGPSRRAHTSARPHLPLLSAASAFRCSAARRNQCPRGHSVLLRAARTGEATERAERRERERHLRLSASATPSAAAISESPARARAVGRAGSN